MPDVLRPPNFWTRDGGWLLPRLLAPMSAVVAASTARRLARPGWPSPVPVICCGNVTAGGAGKTTVALDIGQRLRKRGIATHFLLRGYGGRARGIRRVRPHDPVGLVGDEALLLAEVAPTWIGANRAASARAALEAGARALVMDDGLQNPSLRKDISLLVIDGGSGFGNGRVMPAGPLREPVAAGAARCQAAVLIGEDRTGATRALSPDMPLLRACLRPGPDSARLSGRRILAFAGIGRPAKFFETLTEAGAIVASGRAFPDHHPYSDRDLRRLLKESDRLGAEPVTTLKDAVRLPDWARPRVSVARVHLEWREPDRIEGLLDGLLQAKGGATPWLQPTESSSTVACDNPAHSQE